MKKIPEGRILEHPSQQNSVELKSSNSAWVSGCWAASSKKSNSFPSHYRMAFTNWCDHAR